MEPPGPKQARRFALRTPGGEEEEEAAAAVSAPWLLSRQRSGGEQPREGPAALGLNAPPSLPEGARLAEGHSGSPDSGGPPALGEGAALGPAGERAKAGRGRPVLNGSFAGGNTGAVCARRRGPSSVPRGEGTGLAPFLEDLAAAQGEASGDSYRPSANSFLCPCRDWRLIPRLPLSAPLLPLPSLPPATSVNLFADSFSLTR